MLRKEEILERTSNGLAVFKHYLPGNWRIGRNFLNPLYEDSKASCNIYFDRHSGMYKMKDFGNDSYSGDCFFFVGQLKGLDCNRAADFVEILEIYICPFLSSKFSGEWGIRTPGTVIPYVSLANWWFQPLTQLSKPSFFSKSGANIGQFCGLPK